MNHLLAKKAFELSETLHYGVRSQPQRYHLRLRFLAPSRLAQERDDRAGVTVQVGTTSCSGPRRWHCRHQPFPMVGPIVRAFVLPQPPLTHLAFSGKETSTTDVMTISAKGDPWQCPPFAVTCPIPGFDEKAFQSRSRYTGTLLVDRRMGLPQSLTSQVTTGFGSRASLQLRRNVASPAQKIYFSYVSNVTVNLPRYPKWKCPWWDPPGTWCMKEPGA